MKSSPVPPTSNSIQRGKTVFQASCMDCHMPSGEMDPHRISLHYPNLAYPAEYIYGSDELGIFRTARYGIPTTGMGPVNITDHDLWDVVNFVRHRVQTH
jgi:mono/diheme cytochrome c family protein